MTANPDAELIAACASFIAYAAERDAEALAIDRLSDSEARKAGWAQVAGRAGDPPPAASADRLSDLVDWLRTGKPDPGAVLMSKQDVRGSILRIMHDLGRELSANARKTKVSERSKRLKDIRETAAHLDDLLQGDGIELDFLRLLAAKSEFFERFTDPAGPGIAVSVNLGPPRDSADIFKNLPSDTPPTPARIRYETVRPDLLLRRPLQTLIDAVKENEAALARFEGPGKSTFSERVLGNPRRNLARKCAWLAAQCRGEAALRYRASGKPPDVVLELAARIWTLTTGNPPDVWFPRMVLTGVSDFRAHGLYSPPSKAYANKE